MGFTDRLRSHTLAKLTDAAASALLLSLLFPRTTLPPGVFEASAERLSDAHPRFGWAAGYIAAELAAAPGVTVCTATGLGVVWSEIYQPRIDNPNMARGRAKQIARTGASFMLGMIKELSLAVSESCSSALLSAWKTEFEQAKRQGGATPRQRGLGRKDQLDAVVAQAKRLEHELRSEFGVEDLGDEPSPAERRAVVSIIGTGVSPSQLFDAMQGRAADCRRNRMWEGRDTAELYLRLAWVCSTPQRFARALESAPLPELARSEVVHTQHGTFVAGHLLYGSQAEQAPDPIGPQDFEPLDEWLRKR